MYIYSIYSSFILFLFYFIHVSRQVLKPMMFSVILDFIAEGGPMVIENPQVEKYYELHYLVVISIVSLIHFVVVLYLIPEVENPQVGRNIIIIIKLLFRCFGCYCFVVLFILHLFVFSYVLLFHFLFFLSSFIYSTLNPP